MCLAVEEPGQNQEVLDVLSLLDYIFTVIFSFEMCIKIVCLGFVFDSRYSYMRNSWNVLDGTVVAASILSLSIEAQDIGWVRGFRVLRALRPLRVIKRIPELKQVVNSLFSALPTLGNVMLMLARRAVTPPAPQRRV